METQILQTNIAETDKKQTLSVTLVDIWEFILWIKKPQANFDCNF